MITERMGSQIIEWEVDNTTLSIRVSINQRKWFYPKEAFFQSKYLPPKIKQAYKELCEEKHCRYLGL
jgi:hypothetical protein